MNDAADGWPLPTADAPDALYARVRDACRSAGFAEANIRSRFHLPDLVQFKSRREGRAETARVHDALEVLTDLFMDLADVAEPHARQMLGDAAVDALLDLRLVTADTHGEGRLLATMLMYPTAGVLLISDRTFGPRWRASSVA